MHGEVSLRDRALASGPRLRDDGSLTYHSCRVRKRMSPMDDATLQSLQSLQSLIASELGVTAALLFQSGFTTRHASPREDEHLPDVYLRLALAVVVGVTLFRSLAAHAPRRAPVRTARRDDPRARPVPTPAPSVITAAIRGKDP